ncbi:Carbohydrate esterase family 8 protein [Mycena indigotica]|uniref:Carbohydrate esterase family 8 protein n=1 Tax=Mycena indigotica TaxID=2126181 RepID=A0A8H6S4L8_9AGAR|nr:Carbohydrate esterase family 8 protein [Mycena indigotica]KAF7292663.1 Carbohydrate esterase family 8 protein [Mycena indigotica]
MSGPFVYVPEAEHAAADGYAAYAYPYAQATPPLGYTPFVPPSPALSAASATSHHHPGSRSPSLSVNSTPAYGPGPWSPLGPRPRTNSWAAPPTAGAKAKAAAPGSIALSASAGGSPTLKSALLHPSALLRPGHKKAKSSGNVTFAPSPLVAGLTHPWLDAGVHSSPAFAAAPPFRFDLSIAAFAPERAGSRPGEPTWTPLGAAEFAAEAFYPARYELRITHEALPWPVVLRLEDKKSNKGRRPAKEKDDRHGNDHGTPTAPPPPITLGDVLAALHHTLHVLITAAEWAALPPARKAQVSAAFTARCRAEAVRSGASTAELHDQEQAERAKGLRRVDFLAGQTSFRGLRAREGEGNKDGVFELVTRLKDV